MLGVVSSIQTLVIFQAIQSGAFSKIQKQLSPLILANLKQALSLPSYTYLFIGLERVFAFLMQIALSLVVLYAIRTKQWKYFILAIALHALFDIAPALYQTKLLGIIPVEVIIALFGVMSFIFTVYFKKIFTSIKH